MTHPMTGRVGVHAMSITPFGTDGAIDESLFRQHLRFIADHGVGVYVASQGSGEGDLLSFDEKVALYGIAADELRDHVAPVVNGERATDRVPVVAAGIGLAMSTAMTCDLAVAAAAAGVDAVQVLPPRPGALRLRDDELERHFRSVIEAVDCEVQLSSNAVLAGYALPIALVETLVDAYPNVRTVNASEARPDALREYVTELVTRFGSRVEVRVGMVREIVAMHALGARGVLCFEANVSPRAVTNVWDELEAGEPVTQLAHLLAVNAALSRAGNPRSLKAALEIMGRGGGALRPPYLPLTEAQHSELAEAMRDLLLA
jgi:4-hydroxy-tetrahydrodipicolinate synthase